MIRLLVVSFLIGVLVYFILKSVGLFYHPKRCRRCDGKGYWRGTRADDRIKCDECFGTGRKP